VPATYDEVSLIPASLLHGENAAYLDEKYGQWLSDPDTVEPEWRSVFEQLDRPDPGVRLTPPPPDGRSIFGAGSSAPAGSGLSEEEVQRVARRQAAVVRYINAMRVRGHFLASIDPLTRAPKREHPELTLKYYGLVEADLDAVVETSPAYGLPPRATLRQIRDHLQAVYCASIGAEFMNLDDMEQKNWVLEQLETLPGRRVLTETEVRRVLRKLSDAENFEQLLHQRFPGTKRFSLEGGETLIPLLDLLISGAANRGVREIVMGMAHRGRLNVLTNTLEKPTRLIVAEFQDAKGPTQGSGDVKYHLGYSSDVVTAHGHRVHLSLTPNPSHLEVVNAVVQGRVRAKQDHNGDVERERGMAVLLHGDAAFIGQGSVAEALQLSELAGYTVGGTVHIIVNNQIGFTTAPRESRSTPYATDVARMMGIPIFHVNGENPRAVAAVVDIAIQWRQRYHRDVVIDMYCYRKHGHNEGDEPSFTQPLMYDQIRSRATPRAQQAKALMELGRISQEEVDQIFKESQETLERQAGQPQVDDAPVATLIDELGDKGEDPDTAFYLNTCGDEAANRLASNDAVSPLKGRWEAYTDGEIHEEVTTAVPLSRLVPLLVRANTFPEGFRAHAKIKRVVTQRLEMAQGERLLDWSTAEQAAFASLVTEGYSVRLSGQDSARGTFSQRHAVWTDVSTGDEVFPLDRLTPTQRRFSVIDSNLSEFAVLGFEYGFSLDTPDGLILWEAQFGDFANGAQVIVDQYLSSSEQKWGRLSGLVMLLPHAYEGQGPEHSSARLERYLMQCAQENIQVANCSTPANYFHLLRRQVIRHVRKPLILMTPKSLLRHPDCGSPLSELETGHFQHIIPDPRPLDARAVRRVVFCSGHVYYDLMPSFSTAADADKVAIHRIELLYPFPHEEMTALIAQAPPDAEIVWVQEEPRNMGAWPVIAHWMRKHLPRGEQVRCISRDAAASPATGSHSAHQRQLAEIVAATFSF
jgi:2-oxoglutarate dehydrogenase E1 component